MKTIYRQIIPVAVGGYKAQTTVLDIDGRV
jgi:hypothetical protein